MSNNIISLHGGPLTASQRKSLTSIRTFLGHQRFPLNAEQTLAAALVGVIDAIMAGDQDADDAQDAPPVKAKAV
jgi:hypothetical protein